MDAGENAKSEVARLRNRITLEYQAAMRAMHDSAVVAPHQFITKRLECISEIQEQLVPLVGAHQATRLTWEVLEEGSKGE
jgi:hypothetical protein